LINSRLSPAINGINKICFGIFVFWITEHQAKAEERALVKIFDSEFEN